MPGGNLSLQRMHFIAATGADVWRRSGGFFACLPISPIYPVLSLACPRLRTVSGFVRGQFGNRWPASAVAATGHIAAMPDIARQLVAPEIGAIGWESFRTHRRPAADHGVRDPRRFHLGSDLRAPASIAVVERLPIDVIVTVAGGRGHQTRPLTNTIPLANAVMRPSAAARRPRSLRRDPMSEEPPLESTSCVKRQASYECSRIPAW